MCKGCRKFGDSGPGFREACLMLARSTSVFKLLHNRKRIEDSWNVLSAVSVKGNTRRAWERYKSLWEV